MKKIPLTQRQFALVDDEDYEWLNQWKWYAAWRPSTSSYEAVRSVPAGSERKKRGSLSMARVICGLKYGDKRQTDHANHLTLDNQRHNLRACTCQQNSQNGQKHRAYGGKPTSSVFTGVSRIKKAWTAHITGNFKQRHLGCFGREIDAAHAYDDAATELFGQYANLNFPRRAAQ